MPCHASFLTRIRPIRLAFFCTMALASGCTLAPTYQRPSLPVADHWPKNVTEQEAKPVTAPATTHDMAWQNFFADPALQRLITLSLTNNRDLKVAALTIELVRAQYQIQRATLFPSISANGQGLGQHTPTTLRPLGQPPVMHQYTAGIGFSAYELDFFGRLRSLTEQALEGYFAQQQTKLSAQISLVAEVASTWYTLLADRQRLYIAKNILDAREQTFELTELQVALGTATELNLNQAEAAVQSARSDIAAITNQVERDRHALTLLVGTTIPAEWLGDATLDKQADLPELPVGLPSDVLLARPDIVAAEHQLKAANANIGAARANFFPRITLTGMAGGGSTSLGSLFKAGSDAWSFGPTITLPLFTGGSNLALLDAAKIQRDIAVANYEKAIQTAFREVSDMLVQHDTVAQQWQAQLQQTEAVTRNTLLTEARYQMGVDNYLTLLNSKLALYSAQQTLTSLRLAKLATQVTLYKVLGGGWQTAEPSEEAPT